MIPPSLPPSAPGVHTLARPAPRCRRVVGGARLSYPSQSWRRALADDGVCRTARSCRRSQAGSPTTARSPGSAAERSAGGPWSLPPRDRAWRAITPGFAECVLMAGSGLPFHVVADRHVDRSGVQRRLAVALAAGQTVYLTASAPGAPPPDAAHGRHPYGLPRCPRGGPPATRPRSSSSSTAQGVPASDSTTTATSTRSGFRSRGAGR